MRSTLDAQTTDPVSSIISQLASAQKSNRGAPGYSRWINRPAGRVLAAVAFKTRSTPNQVTICSAAVSAVAIILITTVRPQVWFGIFVAVLLAIAYALDSADGQLARLQGSGGPQGEWLDHVVDCIKSSAIHLAVLICWFRFFDLNNGFLLIPLLFCLQSAVWFFSIILTEKLQYVTAGVASKSDANPGEMAPIGRSLLMLPADYGVLCWTFALLGANSWFVWLYGALMIINAAFLLAALPKWYQSLAPAENQPD